MLLRPAALLVVFGASVLAHAGGYANVALGRPVSFTHEPNYRHCSGRKDNGKMLTDGKYGTACILWTDPGCVGWITGTAGGPRGVTVDLGEDTPITGFSWNFAYGHADVPFPTAIDVYVSVDGTNWSFAGALLERALTLHGTPPPTQYHVYRAHAEDMPCHGRYVMFIASQVWFCFCDEVEVYRGDEGLLGRANPGETTCDPVAFVNTIRLRNHLLEQARAAGAPERIAKRISSEVFFDGYKNLATILPMSDLQRDIWAANGARLRSRGFQKPVLWTSCRWDNLSPFALPPVESCGSDPIVLDMMRGEIRAETVNVLNPTENELTCDFSVEGLGDESPLDCREVLYTDTKTFRLTASALKPGDGSHVRLSIPAGVSKQVWMSVRRPAGSSGERRGRIVARLSDGTELTRPFHLRVRNLDFPSAPRLHTGGWDYIDTGGKFHNTPGNLKDTIEMHRDVGVDVAWAWPTTMPQGATFDAEGRLVSTLDFTKWDRWTKELRPDARIYAVFWSVNDSYCGEKSGTQRFDRMVGEYLRAWIAHARISGLNGRRILLLLVDEPSTVAKQQIIMRWMKPIRMLGVREFATFVDPQFPEPWKCPAEFWDCCDVICPITNMARRDDAMRFWEGLAEKGKEVWLYSAHGPSRTFDPISYYRMQAWTAFRIGSKESGSQFWAFGCAGQTGDSWHAYLQKGAEFSPYFVSPDGVMDAKQNEAIREGVEDYEYLSMLAERNGRENVKKSMSKVFEKLPYGDPDWDAPGRDHALLDRVRVRILDALESQATNAP